MENTKYDYNERIKLKKDILNLSHTEWKDICSCILIPNNENITINRNCTVFDLMSVSDKSIIQIKKYINHTKNVKLKLNLN